MNPVQSHETVSRTTLEEAARRAPQFLRTAGTNARIRALLDAAGYGKKNHAEGCRLYFKVVGYAPPMETPIENGSKAAFSEVAAWQSKGFARARAALRHKHPEVDEFVFHGLTAGQGADAAGTMATFLDRCDALENAPERKATRKSDRAALSTLAGRGITAAVRKHLRARLELATVAADAGSVIEEPAANAAQRRQDLHALYLWLQDWSETARAVISRRSDLIRLGIAKPRRRKKAVAAQETDEKSPPSSRAA
jgi:hypothetical protein